MSIWNKKSIQKQDVENLVQKYGIDPLKASILLRRNIRNGKDIMYFMENDLRFQHTPFHFRQMEDAVDRILSACEKDEDGNSEKILIFGDRDVDGVTATTLLYQQLRHMGADVEYRVPLGNDPYGLTLDAVNEFAAKYGSLIITVDCGIANVQEVSRASELGIDVIIVDHHNPQEELPSPAIILDAKTEDSGYPFGDISGCAAVYKLVSAIRFSSSSWYKTDVALMNVSVEDDAVTIECLKVRNMVPVSKMTETVFMGEKSVSQTRLPQFLRGQLILAWDARTTGAILRQCFGKGAEFNIVDMKSEIAKIFPFVAEKSLGEMKNLSKIARYGNHAPTEIGGFYNIFVTYVQKLLVKENPSFIKAEEQDLELVALAALADAMPMQNENRIMVRKGMEFINAGRIRPGLLELMSSLDLIGKTVTSKDMGWKINPCLNAAGRMGCADVAVELFVQEDGKLREETARKIIGFNNQRKELESEALSFAFTQAESSFKENDGKLCVVYDERIHRGVNGSLAGKLMSNFNVPVISMTFAGDAVIGSVRSCRGFVVTDFIESLKDLFISHGGHDFAAGFSLVKENLEEFRSRVGEMAKKISLKSEDSNLIEIDAEIPPQYMTEDLLELTDFFEPYGESNPPLMLMSRNLEIISGMALGSTGKTLKITVDTEKNKWPCIFFKQGDRWNRDISNGDRVDILYSLERNFYKGMETLQLTLTELEKSK